MVGAGTHHAGVALKEGPAIILVRPQLAVNIGMCARAMANFGLHDLRLVCTREDWPKKGAQAAASGAVYILEAARRYDSLEAATGGLTWALATTARERGQNKEILAPRGAMARAHAEFMRGGSVGVVFGPERTGLQNDEIALCSAMCTFPVNPAYASLNLAQAVLLMGYEWFMAHHGEKLPFAVQERSPFAPRAMIMDFYAFLEDALAQSEFFRPPGKQRVMRRNLLNIFHRMALTEQDVRTLRGLVVRLVAGRRQCPPPRLSSASKATELEQEDEVGEGL